MHQLLRSKSKFSKLPICIHTWTLLVPIVFGPVYFNVDVDYIYIYIVAPHNVLKKI